jgi:hypothetical protein
MGEVPSNPQQLDLLRKMPGLLDPTEAPVGYYAVLKSTVATQSLGNICRACDWRPQCQRPETDFTRHNHRCMGYTVISAIDGRELKRNDECSVVFKRHQEARTDEH